jgi:hypothetical protein
MGERRCVSYVLRFERSGKGLPTVAQGLVTVSALGTGGEPVETVRVATGGGASYDSTYTVDPDGIRFTENGTVTFGRSGADTLAFSTLGSGYLLPPADPETNMTPGIVMWKVDSGTGFFDGATGLIASNFRVNLDTEQLIDDHVATIWRPVAAGAPA